MGNEKTKSNSKKSSLQFIFNQWKTNDEKEYEAKQVLKRARKKAGAGNIIDAKDVQFIMNDLKLGSSNDNNSSTTTNITTTTTNEGENNNEVGNKKIDMDNENTTTVEDIDTKDDNDSNNLNNNSCNITNQIMNVNLFISNFIII